MQRLEQDYENAFVTYIDLTRKLYNDGELTADEWQQHQVCFNLITEHGCQSLRTRLHNQQLYNTRRRLSQEAQKL